MPQTRSAGKVAEKHPETDQKVKQNSTKQSAGSKRKQPTKDKPESKKDEPADVEEQTEAGQTEQQPPAKASKQEENNKNPGLNQEKLDRLLESHGQLPLADYGLKEPEEPTAPTVLAHIFNAMLTSARISHELAAKSVRCLIEANYHELSELRKSSWEERTEVLTKGGYTRYREKTATGLGELVQHIDEKYDGDITNIRKVAEDDPKKVRDLVRDIKGFGEVGTNIFHDTIQALWPFMAPYVDSRSDDTAEELGVGKDVDALWKGVGEDAKKMASLCQALTTVRLEKRQEEFED